MTDAKPVPVALTAHGADPLSGRFVTPGDTAISLRALLLAALTVGRSSITGLRASQDVLMTAAALRELGVVIEQIGPAWQVHGLGVAGLLEPQGPLEPGPSASSSALLLGLLAPYGFATKFAPGAGLSAATRPALLDGLGAVGAQVTEAKNGSVVLQGAGVALPVRRTLRAAPEEIKTALLLACLQTAGDSELRETVATHDHSEKLLAAFGADITVTPDADDGEGATIRLVGLPELRPQRLIVPGDPSAAAYAIVAALVIKGSQLLVENVLINPRRTGLIDTLLEMGGDIQFFNQRETAGEHVADLRVRSSWLKGVRVDGRHAGAMLEDIPALAIAAAFAQGETVINGLGLLGDRLETLAGGLRANRVNVNNGIDSLTIAGDGKVGGGGKVDSKGDAGLAMSFVVLGLGSRHKVTLTDASAIADSFPDFVTMMKALGGRFPPSKGR